MGRKEFKLEKARTGRPCGLTEDVKKRIFYGIKRGATYELSAHYGGVSYDAFLEWMQRGDDHEKRIKEAFLDSEKVKEQKDLKAYKKKMAYYDALVSHEECMFIEFAAEIRRLKSEDAISLLEKIDSAASEPKTWHAAAWKLERVHGRHYSEKTTVVSESKVDITSRNANLNIDFESEKITDNDVVNIYKEYLRNEDVDNG